MGIKKNPFPLHIRQFYKVERASAASSFSGLYITSSRSCMYALDSDASSFCFFKSQLEVEPQW